MAVRDPANERPEGLWIDHDIHICTYDIDFAGHVSNINYLRWLEDMRYKLFEKYFPLKNFLDKGKTPVLTETRIQYKRPIKLFSKPYGVMWISHMGKASLTISAEIYVEKVLTTTAEHTGVFVDLASGKPCRTPVICTELYRTAQELVPVIRPPAFASAERELGLTSAGLECV